MERPVVSPVVITGVGMVTPVGWDTARTSCAIRAGISTFAELPHLVDQGHQAIVGAILPGFDPADSGRHLWNRLATACREAIPERARDRLVGRPWHVSVLTAEAERPGTRFDARLSAEAVCRLLGLPSAGAVDVYPLGNAGGIFALADARRRLAHAPATVEIIVGVDSLIDVAALSYFERAGRLKVAGRPRGAVPGEAAGCIVVESADAAAADGRAAWCTVAGIGVGQEPSPVGSPSPSMAEGLTMAMRSALDMSGWQGNEVGHVFCDLNGEEYRAHEWMLTLCRLLEVGEVTHPADCLGDVGAAFAPVLIGLAALALGRDDEGGRALVACSSDFGARGSVCLQAPPA